MQVLFDDDKQQFVAVQKFPIGIIVFWTYSVNLIWIKTLFSHELINTFSLVRS